jgi:choline-sulfatase
MYDRGDYQVTEQHIRTARHGYYSMISYADQLIGDVLEPMKCTGLLDNTIVMVTADHGDMLGERGLWFKMVFNERSIRVPLIVKMPGESRARRVSQNASLIDLMPTFIDIAGDSARAPAVPLVGASLMPLVRGDKPKAWSDTVYGEYLAEGTTQPVFMIKRGSLKLIVAKGDPVQLYDTASDPHELTNLATDPKHAKTLAAMTSEAAKRWDSDAIRAEVVASQAARLLVQDALVTGRITPWDWEPRIDAARIYNRNYGGELYDTDRRARVPYKKEPAKDGKRTRRDWSRDVK